MPNFEITSPEGKKFVVTAPDGATQDEVLAYAKSQFESQKPKKRDVDIPGPAGLVVGAGENLAKSVTGVAGSVAGGLSGAADVGIQLAHGRPLDRALNSGAETVKKVSNALTYEPRTAKGKTIESGAEVAKQAIKDLSGHIGAVDAEAAGGSDAAGRTIGEAVPDVAATLLGGRALLSPTAPKAPIPGKTVSPLREFTPEQSNRFFRMNEQKVPPTLGAVTRDPATIRFEQQKAQQTQTPAGAAMDSRLREQDEALATSVQKLKKAGTGTNEADTGGAVRAALEKKKASQVQDIDDAYETARASGETKQEVDVTPLVKYLKENEPAALAVRELSSVRAGLRKLVGDEEEKGAAPVGSGKISSRIKKSDSKVQETPKATIDDIEYLRQMAGRLQQKGGSASSFMREVKQIIDKITDGVGGDRYKAARSLRKAMGDEFEEQAGVGKVIDKTSRTDYQTAVEDVWHKSVITGSEADLNAVLTSLRRSATREQAIASRHALDQMQGQTISYLYEQATKASKDGRTSFSPGAFKQALERIGYPKLKQILGPDAVKELRKTLANAEDTKTQSRNTPGSDTYTNQTVVESFASQHLGTMFSHVLPRGLKWAGKLVDAVRDSSEAKARTAAENEAVSDSLNPHRAPAAKVREMAKDVKDQRKSYLLREGVKRTAPVAAATYNENSDR